MCQQQAAGLETIRQEYIAHGRTEISFMIVNSKEVPEQIGQLSSRANFPVYQDTSTTNIWNKLNGGKDDVLIYDRCGKLVYFIPFPSSLLRYHLTDWAIRTAYDTDPCGCQRSLRRSHRRRRRHNHERPHSHRSGGSAIVVGMGRSAVRDMNRTPN
ncbi:selenoprotein P-like [Mytilus trossulus]|uniref:selenoprotein P-like n=1 Tax=Mytilus trossulus TaxID=6551 RepID=UPI00300634F5